VLRIGSIVLRVDDLERQTGFWQAALGYVWRDVQSDDFMLLRPRDGASISCDGARARSRAAQGATLFRSHSVR
jgi:hypothetical protein